MRAAETHPHHARSAVKYLCKLTAWYPTTLFWVTAALTLVAVTAESQSTLVGIIGFQLVIFGLLIHQSVMIRRRYDNQWTNYYGRYQR